MVDKKTQGKKNRASGARFEKRVREDLEEKGWIVDRWTNNVEFSNILEDLVPRVRNYGINESEKDFKKRLKEHKEEIEKNKIGRLLPAKAKWNNFTKSMMMKNSGFPDFIAFKNHTEQSDCGGPCFDVIGVEVKSNGILDKQERAKCCWLIENNIFSKIMIARKTKVKNRIVIEYRDFNMKDGK